MSESPREPDRVETPGAHDGPKPVRRRARVLTVSSNKGGVGKTTVASNLAVYLRALREDLPVLVVGLDDQGTLDRMFAFDQRARISGLYGQVEYLVRSGVKQDAAYEAGEWPFEEDVVRDVLPLAYSQLAAAGLVPRTQLPLV